MDAVFPSQEWVDGLISHLNNDEKYARTAKKWEGSLLFDIQPSGMLQEPVFVFLDLWHGKCRGGQIIDSKEGANADFVLTATYDRFVDVLTSKLDPMQAMMTRKLQVRGSMAYVMRNVPTVLEFVRCAKDVTTGYVGQGQP